MGRLCLPPLFLQMDSFHQGDDGIVVAVSRSKLAPSKVTVLSAATSIASPLRVTSPVEVRLREESMGLSIFGGVPKLIRNVACKIACKNGPMTKRPQRLFEITQTRLDHPRPASPRANSTRVAGAGTEATEAVLYSKASSP